ncbi:NADPH oxidase isoform 2 [Marasmius fiardii PR-910]|nr:NADPH oxidase isoform 2 [Marasmius fiardii PR-910]
MDLVDSHRPTSIIYNDHLADHPDLRPGAYRGAALQRNKTERYRLQGLQRTITATDRQQQQQLIEETQATFLSKWDLWMINEGGRQLFFAIFIILHILVGALGVVHYQVKDNLNTARKTFGAGFTIARSSALLCHIDVIFILLPVCRNFISIMRRSPLGTVIPFDKNITFHKVTGWSIVIWSLVHTLAHVVNVINLSIQSADTTGERVKNFFLLCVEAGPAVTGWIMWVALGLMAWYAFFVLASDCVHSLPRKKGTREKRNAVRTLNGSGTLHHLFIVFFINWQLHGMYCMIKPDRPPYCSSNTIGVFWRYWLVGGVIWIAERVLREVRARHRTYIHKVIQHPSKVVELQIKKDKTKARAGQYIFLNCPEISYFQWHPFTLTSVPEEDYISVHIRVVGDFTTALAKAVGCDFGSKNKDAESTKTTTEGSKVLGTDSNPPINCTLPRVMVDGPFGSASEDFLNYEVVLLVGAGIGVTPFASILKSIWYRLNNFNHSGKPTRLSKVYFTWVIREFGAAEWFHSLLHAIEERDTEGRIEINIYLTAKIKDDDMNKIIILLFRYGDVGAEKDSVTNLRAPTHYGRPNWDRVFTSISNKHPDSDCGVFFCGPKGLSTTLHTMSNKYSRPQGTRFFFGKENF